MKNDGISYQHGIVTARVRGIKDGNGFCGAP